MKIAILTSGILPVPAVKGGAVENLIDFYLEYNDQHRLHDITIYSVADKATAHHPALQSTVNHYYYVNVDSMMAKLRKHIFHKLHAHDEYYHYSIEYFLHEAIQHIRHQHYDLLLLENRPGYALQLRKYTNTPLIYHLHNEKLTYNAKSYQEIYEAAAWIITVSDYIKSCVQSINPQDDKTLTVYNGINLQAFSSGNGKEQRDKMGLDDEDFVMVFSGRVTEEKGIMQLIEAMLLLQDLPKIKLLVIGSSFYGNADNENAFAKALQEKAATLAGRILFTGFIPYHQMPCYLQIADIAVIPSVWDDPFPTTVLEAQAMGLPIITTNRGGIPEEVGTDNAILLHTDDHFIQNLAFSVRDLYRNPEKRKAMSKAAIKRSKYFDKERYARDFFDALSLP